MKLTIELGHFCDHVQKQFALIRFKFLKHAARCDLLTVVLLKRRLPASSFRASVFQKD
jgi:hypothetical protein